MSGNIPNWAVALYTAVCMILGGGILKLIQILEKHEKPFEDPKKELEEHYHRLTLK